MRRWVFRLIFLVLLLFVAACGAFWALEIFPEHGSHPPLKLAAQQPSPFNTRISTFHPRNRPSRTAPCSSATASSPPLATRFEIPAGATLLPCNHCVVTAGFWNAHVHFTEPKWNLAEWKSDDLLNAQLADMFLSRGFTTVIDTGSNPADTFAIRRRIEHVQLNGPYIYSSGPPLYPPNGIPFYIKESAPGWLQRSCPSPERPTQPAASFVAILLLVRT